MLSFKQHLTEKRKNADINIKISAYDALEPYKNDPNIYITFTGVEKVGINPHSSFNTPNAVYTYPLKEAWNMYFDHKKRYVHVPFADESPFVWILKQTGKVFQDISKYTKSNYDADMAKLRILYKKGKILTDMHTDNFNKSKKDLDSKVEMFMTGDRLKIKKPLVAGKVGEFDDHFEFDMDVMNKMYSSEKSRDRTMRMIKMQAEPVLADLRLSNTSSESAIDIIIKAASEKNKDIKTPFNQFWNVTRWIANGGFPDHKLNQKFDNKEKVMDLGKGHLSRKDIAKKPNKKIPTIQKITNVSAQKWNNLLRSLGYIGFSDKNNTGSIHISEPMQAIFLAKNGFKVIEKIRNINPKGK